MNPSTANEVYESAVRFWETPGNCWRFWKLKMIDVQPKEMEVIQIPFVDPRPHCEVRAFGSRVNHTAKTLFGSGSGGGWGESYFLTHNFMRLKEAFEESDLPFRVDLMDWNRLSKEFQTVI
jgi:hypothetical protein